MITSRQAAALDLEGCGFRNEGDKAQAVLAVLGCSMPDYYALLDQAIDDPDAATRYPELVRRLLQARQDRSQAGETTPLLGVVP